MTGAERDDALTAALLLRVWSEPGSPVLRARLVGGDGPDAGGTLATAVGDAEIAREVLRWLERLRGGTPAPSPADPAAADRPPVLVDPAWLAVHRTDPDLAVLQVGDRRERPETDHLPGAGWLDWIDDLQNPDRRGVVDGAGFAAAMDRLGVGTGSHVVLCGGRRPTLAASAAWTLAYHGHRRVSLLDGGVARWVAEGRETAGGPAERTPTAGYRPGPGCRDLLVTRDQLLAGLVGAPPGTALLDCRTAAEYAGRARRPYDVPTDRHRMTGHVPGARSLPTEELLDADGQLLPPHRIRAVCAGLGVGPDDQVVVYCGATDRSALVWFALHEVLGWQDVRCYYGAWSEYGSLTDAPVETGR